MPKNRLSATVNIDVVLKTIKKIPDDNFFNEDTNIIADDIDTYNILKDQRILLLDFVGRK